jgi:hypothetical protein
MQHHAVPMAALAFALSSSLAAQSEIFRQPPIVTGPAPHLPGGTPDLSGVWMGGGSNSGDITKALKPGDTVTMTPWAEKTFKSRLAVEDPEANCLPFGIPRSGPLSLALSANAHALLHPL